VKYGPETPIVEAFLQHLKAMTPKQWDATRAAAGDAAGGWEAAGLAARDAAWGAAGIAARGGAGAATREAVGGAVLDAAWDATWDIMWFTAWDAANEIQGAALMRERGQPFFFLPMFGFADPEAVVSAQKEPAK